VPVQLCPPQIRMNWPGANQGLRSERAATNHLSQAVPWLKSLIAGLSPRRSRFAPGSIHVGFVVEKVALGQGFLRVLRFSPVNILFHSAVALQTHIMWGMRNTLT
jgi:hypothetical protein